ncbi:hypothetical protein SMD44_04114 [Streptomyces alboflavus]|uniref:Uncharacterized protein n=1 Tax=Streptomyces alboflavus TaxID=67267 RepID=A0A1Z1WDY0_9ACTN|nr:hypothetical protein SMD44_04114 [Streptomyces alboflavus]
MYSFRYLDEWASVVATVESLAIPGVTERAEEREY